MQNAKTKTYNIKRKYFMIFIVEAFAQEDMKTKTQNKNINKYHDIKI